MDPRAPQLPAGIEKAIDRVAKTFSNVGQKNADLYEREGLECLKSANVKQYTDCVFKTESFKLSSKFGTHQLYFTSKLEACLANAKQPDQCVGLAESLSNDLLSNF